MFWKKKKNSKSIFSLKGSKYETFPIYSRIIVYIFCLLYVKVCLTNLTHHLSTETIRQNLHAVGSFYFCQQWKQTLHQHKLANDSKRNNKHRYVFDSRHTQKFFIGKLDAKYIYCWFFWLFQFYIYRLFIGAVYHKYLITWKNWQIKRYFFIQFGSCCDHQSQKKFTFTENSF